MVVEILPDPAGHSKDSFYSAEDRKSWQDLSRQVTRSNFYFTVIILDATTGID